MSTYLWFAFGSAAVILAVLNVCWMLLGKDPRWFRFSSMACTALTLCAFYGVAAMYVTRKDWSALMDVVPTMSGMLWFCAIASILINGISLLKKPKR